jgi:hypothetical protein
MCKGVGSNRRGEVVIPQDHPNPPSEHEISVAHIVAQHFGTVVEFLIPVDDYKRKTPDIVMGGVLCEIKSPIGNSRKTTVRKQFQRASNQHARCMIFDGRRTKLSDEYLQAASLSAA